MKKIISPLFCAALFFAACNDETTTVSATSDAEKVTAFKDLDNCDSTIVGKLVYVKDSVKAFICTDEGWAAMSGAAVGNGKSGSDGSDGKDGKDGVDGKNGKDGKDGVDGKNGKNGKDGSDGKDGASCTVAAIEDGYKVLCGGDSVGVLLNGAKGDSGAQGVQGIQGKAGESCTAKENKADGGYDIECGGKKVGSIKNGTNGQSAYELSGTDKNLEDWLASLKGDKGDGCSAEVVDDGVKITCDNLDEPVIIKNGTAGAPGAGCGIESDVKGVVTIKCGTDNAPVRTTLYKALCGGVTPYDPATQICDIRDNQTYKFTTITVASKNYSETWMAENLNYVTEAGSFCYKNSAEYCEKYGRLYTWGVAVGKSEEECGNNQSCDLGDGDVQGVCPDGWHLPSQAEFNALITAAGGSSVAGRALKSKTGWTKRGSVSNNDTYSFGALGAGSGSGSGSDSTFGAELESALFWSSTQDNDNKAYNVSFRYDVNDAYGYFYAKSNGFSVRCIKDK